jgi:hypothetical protein
VAKNGIDSGAHSGGPLQPFLTIKKALDTIAALSTTQHQVVYVAPGAYTESAEIVITRGRVTIQGSAASDTLNGVVTWTLPSLRITIPAPGSTNLNQVCLANLTLSQTSAAPESTPLINDDSPGGHGLVLKNAQLYGKNRLLYFAPQVDSRLYIDESEFVQAPLPVTSPSSIVAVAGGAAQLYRTSITALQNASLLDVLSAGALWTAAFCSFQSVTASADAEPLVRLRSEVSFPSTVQYCGFVYTDTTVKNPAVTRGIEFGGSVSQQLVLVNNYFALLGLGYAGEAVGVNGLAVHQLYTNGCYALPQTAYGVNASVVKLVPVNPRLGI